MLFPPDHIFYTLIWTKFQLNLVFGYPNPGVLNLFLTADRSALDNFAADHPGSSVKLSSGGEGGFGGMVSG